MIYDKRSTIPFWATFLLEFKPMHYSTDDKMTICFKYLFGTMYVLSEITADEDPA